MASEYKQHKLPAPPPVASPLLGAELGPFLRVCVLGWGGFCLQHALLGRPKTALLDLGITGATLVLYRLAGSSEGESHRSRIAHLTIGLSAVGLAGAAWHSGRSSSAAIWYFSCVPMFAAYLRGARAALFWMVVSIGLIGALQISESLVDVPPELVVRGIEATGAQIALTVVILAFALGARDFAARQIRELQDRERVIHEQSRQLASQAEEVVTARDQALAAARLKSEFLANMSHEIRTPLNAVLGMASLLEASALSQDQTECVQSIQKGGDALLSLVSDILDFSKIEAGKLEPEATVFQPHQCIEDALELVAPQARAKRIEVAYVLSPGMPTFFISDPGRLRQILVNLLNNAIKFTHQGSIVIRVSAARRPVGGYDLLFSVCDTGIGIPQDRLDRLFQPFSQVDASTTREYGGTGLGLAICRSLCDLLGGRMWVESRVGMGSSFSFTIHALEAGDQGAKEGPPGTLLGCRVLVVDEEPVIREALAAQLREWGAVPVSAASGPEALTLIEEHRDNLGVAILQPSLLAAGLDLGQALRSRSPRLPLILLRSGHGGSERPPGEPSTSLLGSVGSITKPVRRLPLRTALEAAFSGAKVTTTDSNPPRQAPTGQAQRVLIAEDNIMNQRVALRMLERLGHTADIANNGLEAIEALRQKSYEVLLLDLQMPGMDGLETARRILREWPPGKRPRLIAMTANALPGDRERCLAAGMNDYISKPVSLATLERALMSDEPTAAPASSLSAALDPAIIEDLRLLGQKTGSDLLAEMIRMFLETAPAQMAAARVALAENNASELRFLAHSLKGSCGSLGVLRMYMLAGQLEQVAMKAQLAEAAPLLDRLGEEFRGAQGVLGRLLGS